jgi:mannitol/fructose-specific phosphotransferase system IIA component (Ntr-type)
VGQLGFYDLDKRLEAISAKGDPLEALNAIVPFESFRAEIEAVVRLAPPLAAGIALPHLRCCRRFTIWQMNTLNT